MILNSIKIGTITLKNRLVMPPMATGLAERGHVTDQLVEYYRDRALYSKPGLIITEHSCITEAGRASAIQLSIADDDMIAEHKRIVDAIHEAGSAVFAQLNHGGSAAAPNYPCEIVSASAVANPVGKLTQGKLPRPLTKIENLTLQSEYVRAALRAKKAGYDGVEIHSAHGYLLDQFYSPLSNQREDEYGPQSIENRLRFLTETMQAVRAAIGEMPMAVRLGGADYREGGATEEDAVEACRLLQQAGADLLDISGGMCSYVRPGHKEPGYFSSMTEKIKSAVSTPVLLTGGIQTMDDAEQMLQNDKADLIGVGRALFKDAHWAES